MQGTTSTRSRAAVGLTAESITAAGLQLVRAGGVHRLTMRRVADHLGVRAPTLYHHFANRDALLDAVVARAFADVDDLHELYDRAQTLDEWIDAATTATNRARTWYHTLPGLADTVLRRRHALPAMSAGKALARSEVKALVRAGVPVRRAERISRAHSSWTLYAIAAEERRDDLIVGQLDRIWADGLRALTAGLVAD